MFIQLVSCIALLVFAVTTSSAYSHRNTTSMIDGTITSTIYTTKYYTTTYCPSSNIQNPAHNMSSFSDPISTTLLQPTGSYTRSMVSGTTALASRTLVQPTGSYPVYMVYDSKILGQQPVVSTNVPQIDSKELFIFSNTGYSALSTKFPHSDDMTGTPAFALTRALVASSSALVIPQTNNMSTMYTYFQTSSTDLSNIQVSSFTVAEPKSTVVRSSGTMASVLFTSTPMREATGSAEVPTNTPDGTSPTEIGGPEEDIKTTGLVTAAARRIKRKFSLMVAGAIIATLF